MKKLATLLAFALTLGIFSPSIAADSHENTTAASAKASANSEPKSTNSDVTGSNSDKTKKDKHEKRSARKNNKKDKNADGDGEPMGQIGRKKNVDGGFDFENSKKFHRMGNDQ